MAFQQGLSGLSGASMALDVISNNVANSSTVGFKGATTKFGDVYAAALNGAASGVQVGIGVATAQVAQSFTQGNVTPTNNPLDIAINGNGFFQIRQPDGSMAYTRNGQFELDKSGYIVTPQSAHLQGYPIGAPNGPASDLKLDTSDIPPCITSSVKLGLNLDSRSEPPTVPFQSTATNPLPDPLSYNASTSVALYDSLGNSHIFTMYFVSLADGNWDVLASTDGAPATSLSAGGAGTPTISFDQSGALTTTMPVDVGAQIDPIYGAASPISFTLDCTGSSQYGSAFGVNRLENDGYASGRLTGITIGQDGQVLGRYSNGQSKNVGRIVMANFADPNGLISLGQNLWGESLASGQPMVGAPGSGSLGQLVSGAIEESNVDLTKELVNMIIQQRNYQANSQSIKTQDQILQTLVNLR
ncbi:MAG: flagellar hook protein FlgE [Betaproteobacteria bacterium]|nr:flagellar hook protein FlgE [Betaproteobacteria bacterium]